MEGRGLRKQTEGNSAWPNQRARLPAQPHHFFCPVGYTYSSQAIKGAPARLQTLQYLSLLEPKNHQHWSTSRHPELLSVTMADVLPAPDSHIDHASSIRYWNSVSANVNGMLGGFPQVSRIDLRGSANFLAKLRRLLPGMPAGKLPLGVDCGAGIGRVTEGFLSNACEVVDVVEPVEKFANVVLDGPLKKEGKVGDVYVTGLESWNPDKKYDLIWNQWCVGHLTDAQLVEYIKRCKEALSESGVIVVKENISTDSMGEDIYDEVDSSVTRTDHKFRALFKEAGMNLIKTEEQLGFPKSLGLFPVRFYALRPET